MQRHSPRGVSYVFPEACLETAGSARCVSRNASEGCAPVVAAVSAASRSICLLISGSVCWIFSISGLTANFSAKVITRFVTSEDLAATSSGAMAVAGGGTAECFDSTAVCPKDLPGDAASKKTTVKPMACKLFAKGCFLSVIFIFFSAYSRNRWGSTQPSENSAPVVKPWNSSFHNHGAATAAMRRFSDDADP